MVISVANNKGGVGKTTTTYNLSGILASRGYKVLMIDMDGQANLTDIAGLSESEYGIYEAITGKAPLSYQEIKENLYCSSSNENMNRLDVDLASKPGREFSLKKLISTDHPFDFIFCDCPPNLGIATMNALTASDYVIIPAGGHYMESMKLWFVFALIREIQDYVNPDLKVAGILLTKFKEREVACKKIMEDIKDKYPEYLFRQTIRDNVSIKEAPMMNQDIRTYHKGSMGAFDYDRFTDEFLKRIQ